MRLLVLDIETRPIQGYTWGLRDQTIGINQIIDAGGMLCFAAKWRGERGVHFHAAWDGGEAAMIRRAHKLLNEADGVIGWNSDRFDVRWLNGQFVKHGLSRPRPFAKVDLMKSVRHYQYLPSYKLDFVARFLGIGQKVKTGGFDLWADVLQGCTKAQALMRRYNIADVRLTEAVFDRLHSRGWVKGLPNHATEGGHCCPDCGGERLQARGFQRSRTRRYQRWQCNECGGWSRTVCCEPGSAKLVSVA